jgi:pyridoxine kinase
MPPTIISIQSQVVYGHVGNSAAAFPMRALGIDVAEVPTTLLSNHPHYPTTRGRVLEPVLVADLLRGVEERGLPERAAIVMSGYLGSAAIADEVAAFVGRAKRANPRLTYLCDPVMGDSDIGFFVPAELQAAFAERIVPLADMVTPNAFELAALCGRPVSTPAEAADAAARIKPATVIVTGLAANERSVCTILAEGGGLWTVTNPRIDARPAGTGDLFTGLLAARLAKGLATISAMEAAVAGTFGALKLTAAATWEEMPIIPNISAIIEPGERFPAVQVF